MSIEAVAIALHHSQASGTAKLVLLGIANHDGDAGSFPKTATLARYANVHPRNVTQAVAKLVELGEIVVHAKEGGTRSLRDEIRPNVYEMTLTCPPNCDRTKAHVLLDEHGKPLHFGRSYKGAYDPDRKTRAPRGRTGAAVLEDQGQAVDNGAQDAAQDAPGPSDEISPRDENSARSSDAISASPSDGISATKNHQSNHQENPALVPSVTRESTAVEKSAACEGDAHAHLRATPHAGCVWPGCGCECHGLRAIVPALPRAAAGANAATRKKSNIDPLGLPEEQKSLNRRGAAMARAALRGELTTTEAKDGRQ